MQSKQDLEFLSAEPERFPGLVDLQIAAIEATANAVVITDRTGTIIWANAAFERLTGHQCSEIVGKVTRILKSGHNSGATYEGMWRTILAGNIWRGELINRRKDGSLYDEEMTISPLKDAGGNVTHFVAVKQNVTERKRIEQQTLFKAALLEAQAETTVDGILVVDESNRIVLTNKQFALNFEIPDQLLNTHDDHIVRKFVTEKIEDSEAFTERVEYLNSHKDEKSRDEIRFKNGRLFDRYSAPLIDAEGRYRGRIWYFREITERVQAEERLRLWSRVLDQSAEAIFVCDPQQKILLVNSAFEELTGFSADDAIGQTPRILQSGRQGRAFYQEMWKCISETGSWRGEVWNRRKSGELYVENLSIGSVRDHQGELTHYVGIFSDVTARKQAEERIIHLAHYDALTDLPNRVLLTDRLNQLIKASHRKKSKVAVIFIDLDRFKEVNDSLGHDAGDVLLQQLAGRLCDAVRKEDTVARLGGDEFVVALQGIQTRQDVSVLAEKLISRLVKPVMLNSYELTVTASLGISIYPDDASSGVQLISNADAAMYKAKSTGRNAYHFYTSDLNQHALEMLSVENALRRAVERDEFVLHFQPQVNIRSGGVVGAEALIRWNHPEQGLVMPGKFISIAEERGLIVPIGNWVIEEAARRASAWKDTPGLSIPIAVNVSAVQFRQKGFVDRLADIVRRHGISPACLELELTESIVMRDAESTVEILQNLHKAGFRLSIDDFGTGYSSLRYLQRFPIDKIKIDQSFVADKGAGSIVTAVISLARSLKLKVIAEGVQTREQFELLREQHCDEVQGFLISPALASKDFENLIHDWQPSKILEH